MERSEFVNKLGSKNLVALVIDGGRLLQEEDFRPSTGKELSDLEAIEELATFGGGTVRYEDQDSIASAYRDIAIARLDKLAPPKPAGEVDAIDAARWIASALSSDVFECELFASVIATLRSKDA